MAWDSVHALLEAIKSIEYVILRNYESVETAVEEGEDLDILCSDSDIQKMIETAHAVPLNEKDIGCKDCFNYYTWVNEEKLLLDIRCIGDGYYDAAWEKNMLEKRILKGRFYTLNQEDYAYSILYHALLQKDKNGAVKYLKEFQKLFGEQDEEKLLCVLGNYMYEKGYSPSTPKDRWVYINASAYKTVEDIINGRKD